MLKNKVKTHNFLFLFIFLLTKITIITIKQPINMPENASVKIPNKLPFISAYFLTSSVTVIL